MGSDLAVGISSRAYGFQSTLPAWGATIINVEKDIQTIFQSTLPAWGATKDTLFCANGIFISIHAPRMGNAVKLSKIFIAHASNSVCFFHPLSLLVNNKIKKLVK